MSFLLKQSLLMIAALVLWVDAGAAEQSTNAQARELFKRAYAHAAVGPPIAADPELLRQYPLYPYLQAERIRRALASAGPELAPADERAQTFLVHYAKEPFAQELRRDWLNSLAQRKLWSTFLLQYSEQDADESLRCHWFTARIASGHTDQLAAAISQAWLTPKSLMDCEYPFEWLSAQGVLTADLIEARVRLALENNNPSFARQIAARLPSERAAPLLSWAALLENPQREIDALIREPQRAVETAALIAGWQRLARRQADSALARYDKLVKARHLSEELASRLAVELALPLAWSRRSQALAYFARVRRQDFDDYALEWRARASLWAEDWNGVADSIAAMSDELRQSSRWRYWAARAAEKRRDRALANQLYESVLENDNFYSIMAAARLDREVEPTLEKLVRDDVQIQQIEALPAFVRARELLHNELRSFALREWSFGVQALAADARPQAVHVAARWGWHEQAIITAAQLRIFNDYELLYPRPYEREVAAAAKFVDLPDELIYGVMRQESLFQSDAISSAGARGLLQLLPETARLTARRWQQTRPAADDLFVPRINIRLGAAQLRTLLDRFEGQTVVALAAYNAGPNAAARWLPSEAIEPDIWIENIPYNETRTYVQRILWHQLVFSWLEHGKPQKVERWLAKVG